MTQRDRQTLIILAAGAAVVLGVAFLIWSYILAPLRDYDRTIANLQSEVVQKETDLLMVHKEKKRLEKLRVLSLPASPDHAAAEYANWLHPMLQLSGLREITLTGPPPAALRPPPASQQGKKAGHMTLTFNVRAKGDLATVVKTLDVLKRAPVLHRVRGLTLSQGEEKGFGPRLLNVQLTLEAMIVNKAGATQPFLSAPDMRLLALETVAGLGRAPLGLALAPWVAVKTAVKAQVAADQLARNYTDIARKDIFIGALAAPVEEDSDNVGDLRRFVRLVHTNPTSKEAFLRNLVFRMPEMRVKAIPGSGYDTFQIMNEDRDRILVRGKVLRVEQRDIYFQVEDAVYELHIGQDVAEAMRRPLSENRIEDLELVIDDAFAAEALGGVGKKFKTPGKGQPKNKGPGKGFPIPNVKGPMR